METNTESLADKYIEFIESHMQSTKPRKKPTWDDFFDEVGIETKHRSDFVVACIMKQVKERRDNEDTSIRSKQPKAKHRGNS